MTSDTQTGSGAVQGKLWSARTDDWEAIQEPLFRPVFGAVFDELGIGPGMQLLDVGCGAGLALRLAADRGADVSGLDASPAMISHAQRRVPGAPVTQGEIENLPYPDDGFDLVTGFNSFQYAARPAAALGEAVRVLAPGGRVLALVWAPAEQCEAASFLSAVGQLLPPPPPSAGGPFALSGSDALTDLFSAAELDVRKIADVSCEWRYADETTAIAGLICAGPVVRAIDHAGLDAVLAKTKEFLEPFRTTDGGYLITNDFRYVIGTPQR